MNNSLKEKIERQTRNENENEKFVRKAKQKKKRVSRI